MANNPSFQPTPVAGPTAEGYNYTLPHIPANAYHLLSNLADAIDTAATKLTGHASTLSDIHTNTNNAVTEVTSTSEGLATDALNTLWGNNQSGSQADLSTAQTQLSGMAGSKGIGPGSTDFRSTLNENTSAIQTGLTALENLQQHLNSSGSVVINTPQLEQWKYEVDTLNGSIANINMAIQLLVVSIYNINDSFVHFCQTGLIPGSTLPLFHKNAFAHQASEGNNGSGSNHAKITADQLTKELEAQGVSSDVAAYIPMLAEEHVINLDNIQALIDTGVDPNQIYTWLTEDEEYKITDTSLKELNNNVQLLTDRGGDATASAIWLKDLTPEQITLLKNRTSQAPQISVTNLKELVDPPKLKYEPNAKHDVVRPGVGSQPINGQRALDNSVTYKSDTTSRVTIDQESEEIVVLDDTNNGAYHGHVEKWSQLDADQKNALKTCGFVDSRGRVIIRDRLGNIKKYGKNVVKEK